MGFREITLDELSKSLDVNLSEVREKQRLIQLIVKARKARQMSQAELGKLLGVTQGRIAQIESGVGTSRVTFDVLLNILSSLGYDYRFTLRKVA